MVNVKDQWINPDKQLRIPLQRQQPVLYAWYSTREFWTIGVRNLQT